MSEKKCSEYIVEELKKNGIHTVFGVPGVNVLPLFDRIERDASMHMITTKTELACSYMADGYARVKDMGCFISTTGPGIASAVNGLISSYYDSIPVIALSAQVNISEYGKYGIQEMTGYGRTPDVLSMMKHITKDCHRILSADEVVPKLEQGIKISKSDRKGPVYIEIDEEILREDFKVNSQDITDSGKSNPDKTGATDSGTVMDEVENLLDQGERIVLIIGNGAKEADISDIEVVADKFGMGIVATYLAKGKIDNRKDNYLGVMGCYGNRIANSSIENADVILVVGATLNYLSTAGWTNGMENKKIIRVDLDEEELNRNYKAEIKVKMDAKKFFSLLSKRVSGREDKPFYCDGSALQDYDLEKDKDYSFSPYKAIQVINQYLDENSIVVADVGQNSYWAERYISVNGNNNFIVNGGNGSMGHGVAASVGVRCAQKETNPQGKVFCICGDGGFMMMGNELSTASKNDIDVIWILFNNGSLGTQEAWCKGHEYVVDCSCSGVDFVKYANSQGVDGYKVDSVEELENALSQAVTSGRSTLIDVRLSKEIIPKSYYGTKTVEAKR